MANNITNTQADVFITKVWSMEIIAATSPKFVLADLVWRFDKEGKKKNDTIHVPSLSHLEANDKVQGLGVTKQAPTEANIDIPLDQHKESSFMVEDITELQTNRQLRDMYTAEASTAIQKAIDSALAALASGFSNDKGTYNTAITTDVILDSIEVLDLADVPEEDRHFVYRSDVKRDLLDLEAYTSSDFVDGRPVQTGNIGSLFGVQTYMSNNLVKSTNDTNNMLFHKNALALSMAQMPRVQTEYSLEDLAYLVVVDTVYGVREMRDDFGVLVKT